MSKDARNVRIDIHHGWSVRGVEAVSLDCINGFPSISPLGYAYPIQCPPVTPMPDQLLSARVLRGHCSPLRHWMQDVWLPSGIWILCTVQLCHKHRPVKDHRDSLQEECHHDLHRSHNRHLLKLPLETSQPLTERDIAFPRHDRTARLPKPTIIQEQLTGTRDGRKRVQLLRQGGKEPIEGGRGQILGEIS